MTSRQVFGNYAARSSPCEYLTMAFSPSSAPLRSRWRNNGLSADFLGDYAVTFLPANGRAAASGLQNQIRHAVTYIANELLENAMKYHERDVEIPIQIHLELSSDHITVSVGNGIGVGQAQRYQAFIENLIEGDAAALLLRQQQENATCSDEAISCLGLLTMVCDYDARLGWLFDAYAEKPGALTVTTSAVLQLHTLPGASA